MAHAHLHRPRTGHRRLTHSSASKTDGHQMMDGRRDFRMRTRLTSPQAGTESDWTALNRTTTSTGADFDRAGRYSRQMSPALDQANDWRRRTNHCSTRRLGEDDQQPVAPHARVTDGGLDSDWTTHQSTCKTSGAADYGTARLRIRAGQTTPNATEALELAALNRTV